MIVWMRHETVRAVLELSGLHYWGGGGIRLAEKEAIPAMPAVRICRDPQYMQECLQYG